MCSRFVSVKLDTDDLTTVELRISVLADAIYSCTCHKHMRIPLLHKCTLWLIEPWISYLSQ
jgi:uncharacterized UPF0146 family protein